MRVLTLGVSLFAITLVTHLLIWRVWIPPKPYMGIVGISLGVLALGLGAGAVLVERLGWPAIGAWEALHIILFQMAATLCHLINYTGLEHDSPSASLVRFVDLAKDRGRTMEELEGLITDDESVRTRLQGLVRDGMLASDGERYRLTARGRVFESLFSVWPPILGIPKGD